MNVLSIPWSELRISIRSRSSSTFGKPARAATRRSRVSRYHQLRCSGSYNSKSSRSKKLAESASTPTLKQAAEIGRLHRSQRCGFSTGSDKQSQPAAADPSPRPAQLHASCSFRVSTLHVVQSITSQTPPTACLRTSGSRTISSDLQLCVREDASS
jgi:hypothetical protein